MGLSIHVGQPGKGAQIPSAPQKAVQQKTPPAKQGHPLRLQGWQRPSKFWQLGQHPVSEQLWPEGQQVPLQAWPVGQHVPPAQVWPEGQQVALL